MSSIPGYQESEFRSDGYTHTVFQKGTGPGVIIMHELPGLTQQTIAFADRVHERGVTVVLPLLFGKPNQSPAPLRSAVHVCLSKEFHCFATRKSSPITTWLRSLSRHIHAQCGGPGVGAIGMCLTGGFVLSMMVDESLMAPVLSQPSLPFGFTSGQRAALGVSPSDLRMARERARQGVSLLGLRFTNDWMCPWQRFRTLREEFGERFEEVQICSPDREHHIPRAAHSVLTFSYVAEDGHPTHEAFERVMGFLQERLTTP